MKFVFWQNILSPHQCDFISTLANKHEVTLIVMSKVDKHRQSQHWQSSYSDKVKVIVAPSFYHILRELKTNQKDTFHCFSGFFAYPMLSFVLFLSSFYRKNNIIVSEAVSLMGSKGKIKFLIRKCLSLIFNSRISQVFAIGSSGVSYFKKLGFNNSKVSEFGYFVFPPALRKKKTNEYQYVTFVGRLIELKGIKQLLNMCLLIKDADIKVKIIGGGPLKSFISNFLIKHELDFVELLSDMPRVEVLEVIGSAESLLLPNTGDEGWGVVVNEALLQGTPVICSKKTGANVVVAKNQGVILSDVSAIEIKNAVEYCLKLNRGDIKSVAMEQLTPEVGASYFVQQLSDKDACPPWNNEGVKG